MEPQHAPWGGGLGLGLLLKDVCMKDTVAYTFAANSAFMHENTHGTHLFGPTLVSEHRECLFGRSGPEANHQTSNFSRESSQWVAQCDWATHATVNQRGCGVTLNSVWSSVANSRQTNKQLSHQKQAQKKPNASVTCHSLNSKAYLYNE